MLYEHIKFVADKFLREIQPCCKIAVIAGSVRRGNRDCSDIEIVCVRSSRHLTEFVSMIRKYKRIVGQPTGKQISFYYPLPDEVAIHYGPQMPEVPGTVIQPLNVQVDLFMCNEENFGYIYLLRTGSKEFNMQFLSKLRENDFQAEGGYICRAVTKEKLITRTEEEAFALAGMRFIRPEARN